MIRRIIPAFLVLLMMLAVAGPAFTEETSMEEIIIPGPNGDIYGVLKAPASGGPVPLVILSHGFGGNHAFCQAAADRFAANGFAAYSYDFCGGGFGSRSSGTMMDMSVLTEAADLNAVIDRFKADPRFSCILLWGASQGGFVSAYVSASRPDDIKAAVLEFPAIVLQDDSEARRQADGTFPETVSIMGVKVSRMYDEDATSFNLYDMLPQYPGPVLILHGDKDPIVPLRYSEKAAETFPDARLIVYPGQGHGFTGSAAQQALDAETAFLLEACGTGAAE